MSNMLRVMVGTLTTLVLLGFGGTWIAAGNNWGWLLVGLGAYRGYVLVKQMRAARADAEGPDQPGS